MLHIKPKNWGITNYQKKVNLPQTNFDLKIISHQFRSNVTTNLKQMKIITNGGWCSCTTGRLSLYPDISKYLIGFIILELLAVY